MSAEADRIWDPEVEMPMCCGEWLKGSGGHKIHSSDCEAEGVWNHPDDMYAYCDAHIPEWEKGLLVRNEKDWPCAACRQTSALSVLTQLMRSLSFAGKVDAAKIGVKKILEIRTHLVKVEHTMDAGCGAQRLAPLRVASVRPVTP